MGWYRDDTDEDTFTGGLNGLMVQAVAPDFVGPQDLLHAATFCDTDVVGERVARKFAPAMLYTAGKFRSDILIERAAKSYIQKLHPTADAQDRHILS